MPPPDPGLTAEREYLRQARDDLRRMREHTMSLTAQAGDAVSQAYLELALYRRAKALEDDPDVPLFFGRIDRPDERFYIGRRHVMDRSGDPVVIDWRADVSRAFYRASRHDPQGLVLRRRYGFDRGELTSYEDEHLSDPDEHDVASRILVEEIERPRIGPMRDIVATIQPEQDEVVRAGLDRAVCVQGAPGTGKTAVGLHRAAYLLHAFRERLARAGVLVVGPNDAFLHYIAQVLPTLGEVDVQQVTVAELVESVPVSRVDPPDVAMLKGDVRMAEVISRAIWSHLNQPAEAIVIPRGSRRWRIPAHRLATAVDALRPRGDTYSPGRALLPQRIAHLVLTRLEAGGEITDDRVQNMIARSRPVRDFVDDVWPPVDPVRIVMRLLSDPELLARAADGLIDPRVAADGVTLADLQEQFAHNVRVRELVNEVNRLVTRVREEQNKVRSSGGRSTVIDAIAAKLITEPVRYGKPGLQAHITYLAGMTANVDQKIGRDAIQRYEVLRKEFDALRAEVDRLLGPPLKSQL